MHFKSLFCSIVLSIFILGAVSIANANSEENRNEFAWAKSRLWTAPVPRQIEIEVGGISEELRAACNDFTERVSYIQKFPAEMQKNMFDTFRQLPLTSQRPLSSKFFYAFKTNLPLISTNFTGKEQASLKVTANDKARKDLIPFATFAPEKEWLDSTTIGDFAVKVVNKGAVQLTEHYGLEKLPINIEVHPAESIFLVVKGRDVACDLLAGNVTLSGSIQATVGLSDEDETKAAKFYFHDLSELVRRALDASKSPQRRAGHIGLHFGELLVMAKPDLRDRIDDALDAALDKFFILDSMSRSSVWKDGPLPGEKLPDFDPMSAPVTLNITFRPLQH